MAVVVATGIVLSVAQTLLTALQTKELKELCSNKYESELRKLEDTVTTIKAVLMDAEFKPHDLNYEGQDWFKKLKDAVYDVDDLLDEYKTIAQQLKGMPGGKISKKVRQFFSGNNQFLFGFNKSREIKKIREYLDCIAKNRKEFGSSDHYKHVKRSREITCSRVEEDNIIGRDIDKEVIVDMLLSDSGKDVSFVSIVGMGGLGKTALAQLVFNDHRIKEAFGDLRYWVCVSDQFGMKEILSKMLRTYGLDLEELQIQARSKLDGKKYLLVLDDVWCDKREHWVSFINFLAVGEKGSKILVTSRSREVANVSGTRDDLIYQLKVLSEEESWDLFKSKAFKEREELEDTDLVDIGREITKKCGNVPLSLKVIGSLLYGKNKSMWVSFQRIDLEKMRKKDEEDRIISTLMFSYYNLTPELKSCFGICSLFPKDYIFEKEVLIQLWLAQGYLVATHDGESLEDVGEEYFSILLQRCFFEDVDGSHGEVLFCKMHDLIHDLAQEVAGEESLMLSVGRENTRGNIRHLSISDDVCLNSLSNCSLRTSRTFLQLKRKTCKLEDDVGTILSQCRRLRVLILSPPFLDISFGIRKLPETLGKLLHLRYINLSFNRKLEMLPKSITKLHNLQILELCNCWSLKALPEDISKLVNLRALDIEGCDSLTHMPTGMYTLTCLRKLTMFVFDRDDLKLVKRGEPKDLKALVNHKGKIRLKCLSNISNITEECDISKDENLHIEFLESDTNRHLVADVHEMMLEHVYNIDDLKSIDIDRYEGINLPSWASPVASYFPKLKRIELQNCNGLIHISSLSQLYHLKFLKLRKMENVEYMEKDAPSSLMPFFPSLEKLELEYMNKLKGWWKDLTWKEETGGGSLVYGNGRLEQAVSLPSFPVLRDLCVGFCESMTYFPPCPHVKILRLDNVNEELRFCTKGGILVLPSEVVGSSSVASKSYPITETLFRLEELCMWSNARVFNSLFRLFVQGAIVVKINFLKAKSIERLREGFHRCALSLQDLQISYCYELKSLRLGGMEHLTNLKSLEIRDCTMLDLKKEEGMPWKCLHSLSSLKLWGLPKLSNLPIGFQYLRNLESLEVSYCKKLKTLPEWLDSLTSLQRIRIERCPKLKSFPEAMRKLTSLTELQLIWPSYDFKERCRNPDGDDWSKIQHIPHFLMKYSDNFNDQDNADDSDDSDAEYDEDYDDVDDDDEDEDEEDDDDDDGCLM